MALNNRHWAKGQACVYCNQNEATERDHVPPQGFFTKPLPSDLIVVPICTKCNQEFANNLDEKSRGYLIMRMAYHSASATIVWKEMVLRGLRKNRRMATQIRGSRVRVNIRSPGGLFLGNSDAVRFPNSLFDAFIQRLVRGLYWHCFGTSLDEKCRTQSYWFKGWEFQDPEIKAWVDSGPLQSHAGGQFKFKVFDGRPDDLRLFWAFELHGQLFGAAQCSWGS